MVLRWVAYFLRLFQNSPDSLDTIRHLYLGGELLLPVIIFTEAFFFFFSFSLSTITLASTVASGDDIEIDQMRDGCDGALMCASVKVRTEDSHWLPLRCQSSH